MSQNKNKKVKIIPLILSVLAAFFGVQSNAVRERDFSSGKPIHYIIVGLVAVILFVLILCGMVALIVHHVGK